MQYATEPGEQYGYWSVLTGGPNVHSYSLCRCICGIEKRVRNDWLIRRANPACQACGKAFSTGNIAYVVQRSAYFTQFGSMPADYGFLYVQACGAIARCANTGDERYGGRGIRVHEPWLIDIVAFIGYIATLDRSDLHPGVIYAKITGHRTHLSLDRINNDGHYAPGNLRFATMYQQCRNQRPRRLNRYSERAQMLTADLERSIRKLFVSGVLRADIARLHCVRQCTIQNVIDRPKVIRR